MPEKIRYTKGWKYFLREKYTVELPEFRVRPPTLGDFYALSAGILIIRHGYAWDGASGPALDTKDFLRGSLVHDVLYQMIRDFSLGSDFRKAADQALIRICKEDGMPWWRRKWVYWALRKFGPEDGGKPREVREAP